MGFIERKKKAKRTMKYKVYIRDMETVARNDGGAIAGSNKPKGKRIRCDFWW
jgi:hypothetical protein